MNDLAHLPAGLADRLEAIVGERGLVTGSHEREPYEVDWRGHYHGKAAWCRAIADHVAGMTDRYCLKEHERIFAARPDLRA